VRFLGRDDAGTLEKTLRRQIADQGAPRLVLYYTSGPRDYTDAARAITVALGAFTETTLHFAFCVTGDGYDPEQAAHEEWSRYRAWRVAHGESRRLYEAPAHQFGPHETEDVSRVIAFALALGWDALLAAKPGRRLLALSHDDRMEVYRGFGPGQLAAQLLALGYWQRA
jgi:hypothetical protein